MIKTTLITAAMIAAVPAIAQTGSTASPTSPTTTQAPTGQTAPGQSTSGQLPSSTTSQTTADPMTADTTQSTDTTAATPATTQTATSEAQIAQVVDSQFDTYDKDANGALSSTEFGSWMTALRSANGAKASPTSKEAKTWLKTAFTQADIDKSKSVSKTELTGFLAANKG